MPTDPLGSAAALLPVGASTAAHQVIEDAALAAIKVATEGTQLSAFSIASAMVVDGVDGPPDLRIAISGDTYDVNHTHYPVPLGTVGRSVRVEGIGAGGTALPVSASSIDILYASGTASASGNNALVTVGGGSAIRVHYVSYNPSAAVTCAFRFGAAGTLFLKNTLTTGGAVIAKDFGDFRYVQGTAGETLNLNLSAAIDTVWNVFYSVVDA